jgi:tetratricopeptide (TPR) repeat protein
MEEQDKLVNVHEKLSDFFHQNLKLILASVGIFVLFVFLISFFTYYKNRKEKQAELMLIEAVSKKEPVEALHKVVKKYPETQAGLEAGILLWNIYYNRKDYSSMEKILNYLEEAYPSQIKPLLYYAKASLFENQKNFKTALKYYKKSIKKIPGLKFIGVIDVARSFERNNNPKTALNFYKKYLEEYPEGEYRGLAEYKIYKNLNKQGEKK